MLDAVLKAELIPVLAPVCAAADGQTYNVNADTFAGAIAGALNAKRLLLLTDVPGVLTKDKELIPELTVEECRRLIADGTISGGMIPKIETCIYALEKGVEAVVILDGKVPHAALIELFTDTGPARSSGAEPSLHPSLRGAQRRSNPGAAALYDAGLLRCARNDDVGHDRGRGH